MSTQDDSLEHIVEELSPMHPAQHEYHQLRCDAKWGKTARSLIIAGVIYNIGTLVVLAIYIKMRYGN